MIKQKNSVRNFWRPIIILGIAAVAIMLALLLNRSEMQTVHLEPFYKSYESIEELMAESDLKLAATGTVTSLKEVTKQDRSYPAPPIVNSDFLISIDTVVTGEIAGDITLSVSGGVADDDKVYVSEGVPDLTVGDRILFFASLGDDGKYYPLAGSTAIAFRNDDSSYTVSEHTVTGNADRTTTIEQLQKMRN